MHYRKNLLLPLIMSVAISADAASTSLSLDSCRTLALANNKELRAAEMERRAAHYGRKSAFTAYLPKVSASGIYMHTDRELSLLSDEQKSGLSHIGSARGLSMLSVRIRETCMERRLCSHSLYIWVEKSGLIIK